MVFQHFIPPPVSLCHGRHIDFCLADHGPSDVCHLELWHGWRQCLPIGPAEWTKLSLSRKARAKDTHLPGLRGTQWPIVGVHGLVIEASDSCTRGVCLHHLLCSLNFIEDQDIQLYHFGSSSQMGAQREFISEEVREGSQIIALWWTTLLKSRSMWTSGRRWISHLLIVQLTPSYM